ncbi:MAG: hypothetical protein EBS05_15560 [Proteobacteria bacterium]|nr:hypothetical protein [Pseudomonadota bacterium]
MTQLRKWIVLLSLLAQSEAVHGSDQVSSCIGNMKQIDGAVQQWALEQKKAAADTYSLTDTTLLAYLKGSELPACPGGGHYIAGTNVSGEPSCSAHGTIEQAGVAYRLRRAAYRREGQMKILPWDAVAVGIVCMLIWLLSARGGLSERGRRVLVACVSPVSLAMAVTFIWLMNKGAYSPAPIGQPPGILLTFSGEIGLWLVMKERGGLKAYGVATCLLLPIGLLLCLVWADAR